VHSLAVLLVVEPAADVLVAVGELVGAVVALAVVDKLALKHVTVCKFDDALAVLLALFELACMCVCVCVFMYVCVSVCVCV